MGSPNASRPHIGVLLGDPRLPYDYAPDGRFGADEYEALEQLNEALDALHDFRFTTFDDHTRLFDQLREVPPDLVLNLCDTGYRNEWAQERNLPALLELLDIPYTGADPLAIGLSNDKALVAAAARMLRVPVPHEVVVDLRADPLELPTLYPAFIKPNVSSGSLGITEDSIVHDDAEAEAYLRRLATEFGADEALAQDFLTGAEYTVGLIGNPDGDFTVLPPLEVDFDALDPSLPRLLTWGSKANPDSPYWDKLTFRQAEIDEATWARMVAGCTRLFRRLGFRDYARFDFRAGADGEPRLIDANTNPTWYANGKMAMMAEWAGYSYAEMLGLVLEAAVARYDLGP